MQLPFSLGLDTEFDADSLVHTALGAAARSLQAAARERPDIEVGLVGASVFAVTIVCLDSEMKPLWNACSYADKRTFAFAEAARAQMQQENARQLSAPPPPSPLPPPPRVPTHLISPPLPPPPLHHPPSYDATGTPFAYPYAPPHILRLRSTKTEQQW